MELRTIRLRQSVAFQLRDESSPGVALVAPAVGELTDELRDAVFSSDVVLFDGTFWSNDELRAVRPNARSAREMNHCQSAMAALISCANRQRAGRFIPTSTTPIRF